MGLFEELLFIEDKEKTEDEESEKSAEQQEEAPDESANIPLVGSPVYPRIFWGESTKPLNNQFPNSEYVDDNIHRTYEGLLSYFG